MGGKRKKLFSNHPIEIMIYIKLILFFKLFLIFNRNNVKIIDHNGF